jgi:hypothetical protein
MEKVEGLMRDLNLSEVERKGLNLGLKAGRKGQEAEMQALGKVLSEKPVFAEGLENSLGRVWCPLKGVRCKEMGGNVFLFTFLQGSGKKKALFDGPWKVNNDLIVMVDFDPTKSLEEHVFEAIPIWIRVFKLPLGWMNKENGEKIGDMIGESVDVEVDEDGNAAGEYLRIKVRINIKEPLVRGIPINMGEKDQVKWCPFEYEFLPEFCYTCSIIGHDDRSCSIKVGKGELQQFGGWLRAYILRKTFGGDRVRWHEPRSGRASQGYGFGGNGSRGGSDGLSWKKEDKSGGSLGGGQSNLSGSFEVKNPLKRDKERKKEKEKRCIELPVPEVLENFGKGSTVVDQGLVASFESGKTSDVSGSPSEKTASLHAPVLVHQDGAMHVNHMVKVAEGDSIVVVSAKGNSGSRYKKKKRGGLPEGSRGKLGVQLGGKRGGDSMEVDESNLSTVKKVKIGTGDVPTLLAGLSKQSCENQ